MCGIAGWVDYERDLTRERQVLGEMTRTMQKRGPDAEGLWIAPHAGLGHRRLSIIDLEGGRQPMLAGREDAPAAVLVYTGEVYNFRELRSELSERGHRFHTRSDTEVVLRAYQEWGDTCPERLNGMFAFAIWDTAKEELLLVRDRLGIKPLYYQPVATGVLFGSEPKAILVNPLARPVLDADGMRELLTLTKRPGRAVLRDLHEVRPGHFVRVRREGVTEHRYWALSAQPHTHDLKDTVRTVRELLDDIIAHQIVSDVPMCTLLSGGLDSSSVTALAQRALVAQGGGPVRSFSVDFFGYEENFQADALRATPDRPFVAEMVRHVGSEHADITLSASELADPETRAAVLRAHDLPFTFGDTDASMYLLFRAVRQRSTVALSGEASDEVFGGYIWFHEPESIAASTFPWIASRMRSARLGSIPTLLDPALFFRLDLFGYFADSYRDALAEVPHLPGEEGQERRMREVSYLHFSRFLPRLLDRKDRTSMASGLEVRVPFCDHRLVEYAFNVPWSMKTFDGREKSLLRAACADLLPRSVLDRQKSAYPVTQDPAYTNALRSQLAALLDDKDAPVQPLLNITAARAIATGNDQLSRVLVEQALILNAWLTQYRVQLCL